MSINLKTNQRKKGVRNPTFSAYSIAEVFCQNKGKYEISRHFSMQKKQSFVSHDSVMAPPCLFVDLQKEKKQIRQLNVADLHSDKTCSAVQNLVFLSIELLFRDNSTIQEFLVVLQQLYLFLF